MRQALAAIAAVLVLAAVLGAGFLALENVGSDGGAAAEAPDATVDAYLEAWSDGDHETMADLVRDPPSDFVAHHEQLRRGLELEGLTVERTDLVEDVDGRATATARVTATADVVEPFSWDVELRLLRERGRWGVAWAPETLHPDWRPGLVFVTTTAQAERAPILARDGTELAGPGERVTYGFEPSGIDADELVTAFEAAIPGSGDTVERLLARDDLVTGWFYPVASLPAEQAETIGSELTGVPGVLRRTEEGARNLFAEDFAVHVIGRTGEATAEDLERLGPPYEPGDHVGRTGLEEVLEARLAAREEVRKELRDGEDGPVRATLAVGFVPRDGDEDAVRSGPVTTTLDVEVQRAVENTLLGRRTPTAIVVVDAADGAIRAAASRPIDGFNRAFEGRYPPGTVFAPVVVDALVAAGGDPAATVACPLEVVVAGRRVENATGADLDEVPLPEAVDAGCATALAELGAELGGEALTAAAERFGAGVAPVVPLFANGFSFPEPVDLGEAAVAATGQGRVEVSPLHLATVGAAAIEGRWWPPYLLETDGPASAVGLTPGALDGLERLFAGDGAEEAEEAEEADGDDAGLRGIGGRARGADQEQHSWFVGAIDGLGVAVLVEDAEDPGDAEDDTPAPEVAASDLATRFARELTALREDPSDEGS